MAPQRIGRRTSVIVLAMCFTLALAASMRADAAVASRFDLAEGLEKANAGTQTPREPGTVVNEAAALQSPLVPFRLVRPAQLPAQPWLSGHRGVDLAAVSRSEVVAPASGVVTFAGTVVDRPVLTIEHPNGLRSSLEPVDATVDVGDSVGAGQVVGTVAEGRTHCAPDTCLHWGVRRSETYLDPLDVLAGYGPVRLLKVDP